MPVQKKPFQGLKHLGSYPILSPGRGRSKPVLSNESVRSQGDRFYESVFVFRKIGFRKVSTRSRLVWRWRRKANRGWIVAVAVVRVQRVRRISWDLLLLLLLMLLLLLFVELVILARRFSRMQMLNGFFVLRRRTSFRRLFLESF